MTRDPSPADTRAYLHPGHVDALALELHTLRCEPLFGPTPHTTEHHINLHRAQARFLLQQLRDLHHLQLTTADPGDTTWAASSRSTSP